MSLATVKWWRVISREKSSIYFRVFTDLDLFCTDIFSNFLWQMTVYLVGYVKRKLYPKQLTVLLGRRHPKHNTIEQFWKIKFHFEHFLRKWRSTNYFYLFENHRQTFSWPGERPSYHLKVNKIWFVVQTLITFQNRSCGFLLPKKHLLFFLIPC